MFSHWMCLKICSGIKIWIVQFFGHRNLLFHSSDCFEQLLKVRLCQKEFMKSSIFQNCNSKIWNIFALKVLSRFFKKGSPCVLKVISTYCFLIKRQINYYGRNPSNVRVANLEYWWLHKFILNLSDLKQLQSEPDLGVK